jgi:hypothetical protein
MARIGSQYNYLNYFIRSLVGAFMVGGNAVSVRYTFEMA